MHVSLPTDLPVCDLRGSAALPGDVLRHPPVIKNADEEYDDGQQRRGP